MISSGVYMWSLFFISIFYRLCILLYIYYCICFFNCDISYHIANVIDHVNYFNIYKLLLALRGKKKWKYYERTNMSEEIGGRVKSPIRIWRSRLKAIPLLEKMRVQLSKVYGMTVQYTITPYLFGFLMTGGSGCLYYHISSQKCAE